MLRFGLAAFVVFASCSKNDMPAKETEPREAPTGKDAAQPQADAAKPSPASKCVATRKAQVATAPSARGPWAVGAKTLEFDGRAVEVWYPAKAPKKGTKKHSYDLREHLPEAQAKKVSDDVNPRQACDCYKDIEADAESGPYPVVLFFHGAGSFRTQSAGLCAHLASRGFVVIAPDQPGIHLRVALGGKSEGNVFEAGAKLLSRVRKKSGAFQEIAGLMNTERIGVVGHSLGGGVAASLRNQPGVVAIASLASGGVGESHYPINTLIMGGALDGVVPIARQRRAFEAEQDPAAFVEIVGAGHLAFSDLCLIGRERGGILEIASRAGVKIPSIIRKLGKDGCGPKNLRAERGLEIIRYATTGLLEESLHCVARDRWRPIHEKFKDEISASFRP